MLFYSLQDIPDAEDKRQKTDVPALNSKQNNKQNFYNAHGAEYIANVCWWLWSTGHLLLAM